MHRYVHIQKHVLGTPHGVFNWYHAGGPVHVVRTLLLQTDMVEKFIWGEHFHTTNFYGGVTYYTYVSLNTMANWANFCHSD